MRRLSYVAGCAVAVLAGLFIAYVVSMHHRADIADVPVSLSPRARAEATRLVLPVVQATPAAVDPARAIRVRYQTTNNYAAFIHDAMQRPLEGGRYYALLAYNRCFAATAVKPPSASHAEHGSARIKAMNELDQIKARCEGVNALFPDELAFFRAMQSINARGTADILLAREYMYGARTIEEGRGEIKRALDSRDPYLIAATLEMNVSAFGEKIDPQFADGKNMDILSMASAAAGCEIVGNCINNLHVHAACAVGGPCQFNDFRDFLRSGVAPESLALFDKAKLEIVRMARQ